MRGRVEGRGGDARADRRTDAGRVEDDAPHRTAGLPRTPRGTGRAIATTSTGGHPRGMMKGADWKSGGKFHIPTPTRRTQAPPGGWKRRVGACVSNLDVGQGPTGIEPDVLSRGGRSDARPTAPAERLAHPGGTSEDISTSRHYGTEIISRLDARPGARAPI